MIDGMGDNAGSFDKLIPHLPTTLHYICIDLPGHGKSSYFPQYLPEHIINVIFTYKLIVDYLNRDKYIVIGHSWGGRTTILFTHLYPDCVIKLILIDPVYWNYITVNKCKLYVTRQIDHVMEINNALIKQRTSRSNTYDEAFKKVQDGIYHRNLDKEAVEALLRRSLIGTENEQFLFTNDPRSKMPPMNLGLDEAFMNDLIKTFPPTCPVLVIIASKVPELIKFSRKTSIIDTIKKSNEKCIVKKVPGDHDVHMKQPEMVATLISTFLNSTQSKL